MKKEDLNEEENENQNLIENNQENNPEIIQKEQEDNNLQDQPRETKVSIQIHE